MSRLLLVLYASVLASGGALAQGITTATLTGAVRAPDGNSDGSRVRIVNRANGYAVESEVRRGRYFVSGLESGGPYTIEVRRIGLGPQRRDSITLRAGEQVEIDFMLESAAIALDTVRVASTGDRRSASRSSVAGGGAGATISEGVLRDMPALNRDLLDLTRLVPEIGTRFGGISGGGASYRLNSYLIDGVSERMLNSNGMLSGASGGRPISMEAVKEYQVLLSPYEPRYGDFVGALVNAITKSGTNELRGTAFVYARNEALARNTSFLRNTPYDRSQVGFSVGGPILRDRAHFFIASEFQRFDQPSTGPFVGGSDDPLPAGEADIQRFETILRGYGLEPGTGERITRGNPSSNVFARVDVALPRWQSRLMLRHNAADVWQTFFARAAGTTRFALTSNAWTNRQRRGSTALQLVTRLPNGWTNELLVDRALAPSRATTFARMPIIEVGVQASTAVATSPTTRTTLAAGAPDVGQGTGADMKTFEASDHLTYHAGRHTWSLGARLETFAFNNISTRGQFGRWNFANLDDLALGQAQRFRVEKDFGSATRVLRGRQASVYVGDSWRAAGGLTLTGGLRAEALAFASRPSYNAVIDSIYGRRTDHFPRTQTHLLPRLGFVLDIGPGARLRGGAGLFAGRAPLPWVAQALRFDGVGTRSLNCQGSGEVPAFAPSPDNMPTSCINGKTFAHGLVNLIDPNLRMAEMFRSSLAYERTLPWAMATSIEALYTRTRSDFVFVNPNLIRSAAAGAHGRVMYGTVLTSGVARPDSVSSDFPELIDVRNHGNGHAMSLTGRVEKRFGEQVEASASYTRSRVRDVQSVITTAPVLTYAFWATSRAVAGRHEELSTGISAYEIPHRVLLAAGWTSPARRWTTTISLYYVGEAGIPFTYTDSTSGALTPKGDLNADGSNSNDPIYVPRNALDPAEIRFDDSEGTALLERQAFESFIQRTPCLRRQRGRILARNSCSGPWTHTANAAVRQQLPARWIAGHSVSLDVEVFNLLNLLHSRWGLVRDPATVALEHVSQDVTASPSQPVFRFDPARAVHSTANVESAYQIQLALRYRF